MEKLIETWWHQFEISPRWNQVVLQLWIYGLFCWLQDSLETDKYIPTTAEELFEYADEFIEIPRDIEFLKPSFNILLENNIRLIPFEKIYNKFLEKVATIDKKVEIINILCTGDDFTEEQINNVWDALAFQIDTPMHKKNTTKRVHGRRAITPLRRRKGIKAITKHRAPL